VRLQPTNYIHDFIEATTSTGSTIIKVYESIDHKNDNAVLDAFP